MSHPAPHSPSSRPTPDSPLPDEPPPLPPKNASVHSPHSSPSGPSRSNTTVTSRTQRSFVSIAPSEAAVTIAQIARPASASSHVLLHRPSAAQISIAGSVPPGRPRESSVSTLHHLPDLSTESISVHAYPHVHSARVDGRARESSDSHQVHLLEALARLPWAQPPPRAYSPTSPLPHSPRLSSPLPPIASLPRDIDSDQGHPPIPHQQEPWRESTFSRQTETSLPFSPNYPLFFNPSSTTRDRAFSFLANDPAATPYTSTAGLSHRSSRVSVASASSRVDNRLSAWSGMADVMLPEDDESPVAIEFVRGDESRAASSAMATKRSSASTIFHSRSNSTKSSRSNKSGKASRHGGKKSLSIKSKRGSGGTMRWQVELTPVAELEAELRKKEEMMELVSLVGRAAVLERMLKAGKRVSNPNSIHHGRPPSLQSLYRALTHTTRSHSVSTPLSGSRPPTASSKRSSGLTSIRARLSRRVKRRESREDIFTELGSDDETPPVPFSSHNRSKSAQSRQERKKGHMRFASVGKAGGVHIVKGKDVQGPPTPPKDRPIAQEKVGGIKLVKCCSSPGIPSSPTPLLGEEQRQYASTDIEAQSTVWSEKGFRYVPQSPHLGHRSPDWRKRQSVLSYLTTGEWEDQRKRRWRIVAAVVSLVGVILITGLLAGLLSRRETRQDVNT